MRCFDFRKIRKLCLSTKGLIIVLIVLVVIGFGLAVYFGVKVSNAKKEFAEIGPREKLERIHSYAVVLETFKEFRREKGGRDTTVELEKAVLATNSGVLKTLFDEIVLGGNLDKDMDYFLDAAIDSLKFFSK